EVVRLMWSVRGTWPPKDLGVASPGRERVGEPSLARPSPLRFSSLRWRWFARKPSERKGNSMKKLALLLGVAGATLMLAASGAPWAGAAFPGQAGLLAVVGSDGIAAAPPNGADGHGIYGGSGKQFGDVAWSPSGTQLAFSMSTNSGPFQIWVVNLDGSGAH